MNELIYFVDDDEINNIANERLLKKMQIAINTKSFIEPDEALRSLQNLEPGAEPNLIVLDINMPKLSGWEFLKRYEMLNLDIPVLMLSSSLDPIDQLKAKNNKKVIDFLSKPLLAEHVKQIFAKCGFGHLLPV